MQYWIIGSGPAGRSAAAELRRLDTKADIGLVTEETEPVYSRLELPSYLSGERSRDELIGNAKDFAREYDLQLITGRRVVNLDPKKNLLVLSDKRQLRFDRLLIATGTRPKVPSFQHTSDALYSFRTLADAQRLVRTLEHLENALVYGNGILAVETARALKKRGLEVTVIADDEGLWPNHFGGLTGEQVSEYLQSLGITVHENDPITDLLDEATFHYFARTRSGRTIRTQLIVQLLGCLPRTRFLRNAGVEGNGGIFVNKYLQSSREDVFAAGDCAVIEDTEKSAQRSNFGWLSAIRQGKLAAKNMIGEQPVEVDVTSDDYFFRLEGGDPASRWNLHGDATS
ncbi:hypothetical protein GF324_09160 [bacterium]|nr:hypothetical protein [bacterium]